MILSNVALCYNAVKNTAQQRDSIYFTVHCSEEHTFFKAALGVAQGTIQGAGPGLSVHVHFVQLQITFEDKMSNVPIEVVLNNS